MTTSESIHELAAALAKAQAAMDCIEEGRILNAIGRKAIAPGRQHSYKPLAQRIYERVMWGATDCWHYAGPLNTFGYGRFSYEGRLQMAHRLSYRAFVGTIPDGMSVLHRCDNRVCVNPEHLWLGTYSDNRRDCVAKGRTRLPRGDNHYIRRRKMERLNNGSL